MKSFSVQNILLNLLVRTFHTHGFDLNINLCEFKVTLGTFSICPRAPAITDVKHI